MQDGCSLREVHSKYIDGERFNYSDFFVRGFDYKEFFEGREDKPSLGERVERTIETSLDEVYESREEAEISAYNIICQVLREAGVTKDRLEIEESCAKERRDERDEPVHQRL